MMEATHAVTEQSPNYPQPTPANSTETDVPTVTTTTADTIPQADPYATLQLDPEVRKKLVADKANELFKRNADWVTFFREVLGHAGAAWRLFPTIEQMEQFEKTSEYSEIQTMLAQLRLSSATAPNDEEEPTKVITVRLPKSLHESLRSEAHERKTSMNKLCISKLLQLIDQQLIPHE